jgi:hypothetical protein
MFSITYEASRLPGRPSPYGTEQVVFSVIMVKERKCSVFSGCNTRFWVDVAAVQRKWFMDVLKCRKHERFALLVAKGVSATRAYVSAGYSVRGAAPSASRLLRDEKVRGRVREILETLSAKTITGEISRRNTRVAALQQRWDRLRASLDLILDQRSADMADLPGGASGLLVRLYKGKKADRVVTRIDTRVISLFAELRAHERQAAEELGQWKTGVKEPQPHDASSTAIPLAMICTKEQLEEMERRALALQRDLELERTAQV